MLKSTVSGWWSTRIASGVPQVYMVDDQRHASMRPDVLTFQTDPLDDEVTIGGPLLAKLFEEQAEEEKQHAMKFIKYVQDTKGGLHIPAIPAPKANFATAEDAVQAALNWEKEVTQQITALMTTANKENDYLAQSFLQWFIDEQLEEVVKMERVLGVVKHSGEKNLLMVEAYLIHIEKAH